MNGNSASLRCVTRGLLAAFWSVLPLAGWAATLEVGPGKPFARIEEANAAAQAGDMILVHPREGNQPYEQTAVFVRQKDLTFRAVPQQDSQWVQISGKGFDYSGRGSTPRAIFQFNAGADGCLLEGFELFGAHNDSHNGAGVRINQSNHTRIRNCHIHHNDMGIMSNGDGSPSKGVDQRIESCQIHHNGDVEDPGYNHNLYLGGTSATLSFCEVHSSLTGHNVKSRAHQTRVEYSYVHHSANREFDLVDAADTARPGSDAVVLGCIVVKNPQATGNRTVLHFGQDGKGQHDGTVYLAFNTIVTPYIAPVVDLSATGAKANLVGNLICDGGVRQSNQVVANARDGATLANVTGGCNWFSGGFSLASGIGLDAPTNLFRRSDRPLFVAPEQHDYRLRDEFVRIAVAQPACRQPELPATPGEEPAAGDRPLAWQYRHPAGRAPRPVATPPILGAYGRSSP